MATLIMVSVTLVAGMALIGFVNGQASVSENQYGQAVAKNVNYINEHFTVVSVQFTCSGSGNPEYCTGVSVSVYNNGGAALTIASVSVTNVGTVNVPGTFCVPELYVISNSSLTRSVETTPDTSTPSPSCTYNSSPSSVNGGAIVLSPSATPIPVNQIPPTTFAFAIGTSPGIMVGANYQVSVQGYYGNAVTVQVTASG